VLGLLFRLDALAALTATITLVTFSLANLALAQVKRRDPRPPGLLVWPLWVPAAGFVISLGVACFELVRRL